MKIEFVDALLGCNKIVGCLDWGPGNLIAFASHHFVAIYDTQQKRVLGFLNGHQGQVNCVKWIHRSAKLLDGYLISGSADQTVCIWRWKDQKGTRISTLKDSTSGVACLASYNRNPESCNTKIIIASCSGDPGIFIYENQDPAEKSDSIILHDWTLKQKIMTGTILQHCLAFSSLPSNPDCLLLASGGTDSAVHLFVCKNNETFVPACKLYGHENWIRSLDFFPVDQECKLLLASASQDRFARVWSISLRSSEQETALSKLSLLAPSLSFNISDFQYAIKLDGLLTGHEDWVQSVQFCNAGGNEIQLLTASMDRTMIIWKWDSLHEWWIQTNSVGDAGSSSLGYFGGVYSPDGTSILAHGFTGALHHWIKDNGGNWIPQNSLTGHCSEVVDIAFALEETEDAISNSLCLVSASKDQTTRISAFVDNQWCEIARPQVHGHDFYGLTFIPRRLPWSIVTCSEEKVIRVFEAPLSFHQYLYLHNLSKTSIESLDRSNQSDKKIAFGATIKALALTNTAVYQGESRNDEGHEKYEMEGVVENYTPGPDLAPNAAPCVAQGPPLEEHLSQNTLWPETQKLYGHGDVVYSLSVSPCGQYLASACKAQREDTAMIFIWSTKTWTCKQKLKGHTLTVTRMQFSPSGKYLLSGSRDRTFCVFEQKNEEFQLLHHQMKAHGRIIWDVSWSPDESFFCTGARDQSIKFWTISGCHLIKTISFQAPVTSVSFYHGPEAFTEAKDAYIIAIGLQTGELEIWGTQRLLSVSQELQCMKHWSADEQNQHSGAVYRLQWTSSEASNQSMLTSCILASCSADHSVRLFHVQSNSNQLQVE